MIGFASRIRWFLGALFLILAPEVSLAGTILVLGDSISAGYGLENPALGWVERMQQRLDEQKQGWTVVNASISGDTSAGGLARIDDLLKRHKPAIVIVELGGNDGLRGLPPARLEQNLSAIIERSQKAGAKVLLLGMRMPPNYGRRYTELFEGVFAKLAKERQIAFVPFLLEGIGADKSLMQPDGIHPRLEAQPLMLDLVWGRLEPLL